MQEDLFKEMDMGSNIQKLEDEIRKLLNAFQTATKSQVQDIHLHCGYSRPQNITIRVGKCDC